MRPVIIIALLFLEVVAPVATYACTCICPNRVNDQKEMMREAKAVFVGEVIGFREATAEDSRNRSAPYVFRVRVDRYWKGVKTPEVSISAVRESLPGCCGEELKVGEKYLFYAVHKDLRTSCTRTRRLDRADEDLKVLGIGKSFYRSN
jgi:hypothetical protein